MGGSNGPERPHCVDASADDRMYVEGILQRRSERHDSGDQVGAALREYPREAATAALADDGHLLAAVLGQALQPLLQALDGASGAVDVPGDPGATGAMAGPLEPAGHPAERLVVSEEPGDEHDRLAAAVRDAFAAPDRRTHERGEL